MAGRSPISLEQLLGAMGDDVVTAQTLAARFGVTERTIYRGIARLRRHGHRVAASSGVGYMLRRPPVAGAGTHG